MGMKLNFDEFIGDSGITPEEAEQTTRILHATGLFDYFSISSSNYHSLHYLMPPESSGLTTHTAAHGAIARRVVNGEVPVMVTGTIRTVEQAAEIVRSGQADVVGNGPGPYRRPGDHGQGAVRPPGRDQTLRWGQPGMLETARHRESTAPSTRQPAARPSGALPRPYVPTRRERSSSSVEDRAG